MGSVYKEVTTQVRRGSRPTPAEKKGTVRELAVLALVCESPKPLSVTEATALLNVPRPTVHRLLQSLVDQGWITASGSPRRYAPSWRTVRLGFQAAMNNRTREVLLEVALELAKQILHTVHLLFYEDGDVVCTDRAEVRGQRVMLKIMAGRWRFRSTVAGSLLLAYQTTEEIERAFEQQVLHFNGAAESEKERFLEELAALRDRGFAVNENYGGMIGIAVPVFKGPKEVVAALGTTIHGQAGRDIIDGIVTRALTASRQASEDLGFHAVALP